MTGPVVRVLHGPGLDLRVREEILDLHDEVYAGSGDPLAEREVFAGFLDHWAGRDGFACSTARVEGRLVGCAYGAPLTAGTSWWEGMDPPLTPEEAAETGRRTFALSELMLDQQWRRTGLSKRLHASLLEERGEERVTLLVHTEHEGVVALYRKWGYQPLGAAHPFEDAPPLTAMLRPLQT